MAGLVVVLIVLGCLFKGGVKAIGTIAVILLFGAMVFWFFGFIGISIYDSLTGFTTQ